MSEIKCWALTCDSNKLIFRMFLIFHLKSVNCCFSREHASEHIAVLVEADKRGHYSHGFNRLRGHYVADIRSKVI